MIDPRLCSLKRENESPAGRARKRRQLVRQKCLRALFKFNGGKHGKPGPKCAPCADAETEQRRARWRERSNRHNAKRRESAA